MFIEIPGVVEQLRSNDNNLRLGYFVGSGNDSNKTGFLGTSTLQMSRNNCWFVKRNQGGQYFGCISANFLDQNDEVISSPTRLTLSDTLYAGKPVFQGDYYYLFYSPSEGKYIYMRDSTSPHGPREPNYVTNTLSGTTSGEYFWKTDLTEIPYRANDYDSVWGRQSITGALAGATDEWTSSSPRYISGAIYLPRYVYEQNAADEFPAGKYVWLESSGDYFHFGRLHYKDQNGGTWDLVTDNPYTIRGPKVRIRYYDDEESEPMGAGFYDRRSVENGTFHYADAEPEDQTIEVLGYSACSGKYTRMTEEDYMLTMSGHTIKDCTSSTRIMMGEVSLWR